MINSAEWLAFMLLKKYPLHKWDHLYPNCFQLFNSIILIVEFGRAPQAYMQKKIKTQIQRTRTDVEEILDNKIFLYV